MAGRGLARTDGRKQIENTDRPKMSEKKGSFFNMGTLMKSKDLAQKAQSRKKKSTKDLGQEDSNKLPEPIVLSKAQSSTSTRPAHPSVLSSYTLDELKHFCIELNIDYSQYEGLDNEKKKIVAALAATYPPDPERVNYLKLGRLEEYLESYKERLAEYKKQKEQAKSDGIPFDESPPVHSQEIVQEVEKMFNELLKKFEVEPDITQKLVKSFTITEKIQHLRNSICVLDGDPNFMQEDEDMITIMDSDRFIDSIRLLTCKYRIMHSNEDWLSNFCTSGGISVLVENMDNRLDKDPMENTDAAALLQLIYCLKHIMQTDGLNVAIATRGAIDAFCMSLRFEYPTLALEVLGILSVVCTFGGSEGVTQTVMGLHHLARVRQEKPFAILVDALRHENPQIQAAVLALVNAIMNVNIDLSERISYRNDLRAVRFNEAVHSMLEVLSGNRKTIQSQELVRSASLARLEHKNQTIKFQPGLSISHDDVLQALAEDGQTIIHPEKGIMAGICWEAKKSKSGVKKRWYEVKNGVFSWYHLEERQKDVNCEPNGSQDMASVVEIMGYSTSNDLQLMFKHCFVFQCSDGQRYQFGVLDKITKERWIIALNTSMARASQERTAYKMENNKRLSPEIINQAKIDFKKQAEIYHGIESTDREIFLSACKDYSIPRSQEISGFLQQEFLSRGKEVGQTLNKDFLRMLTELLESIGDSTNASNILNNMISSISMTQSVGSGGLDLKDLTNKNQKPSTTSSSYDIETLLSENEALRNRLMANPEKKKIGWKDMLGLVKSQSSNKKELAAPVARQSSILDAFRESKKNQNNTAVEAPLPPTNLDSTVTPPTADVSVVDVKSASSAPIETKIETKNETEVTKPKKLAANSAIGDLFAARSNVPVAPISKVEKAPSVPPQNTSDTTSTTPSTTTQKESSNSSNEISKPSENTNTTEDSSNKLKNTATNESSTTIRLSGPGRVGNAGGALAGLFANRKPVSIPPLDGSSKAGGGAGLGGEVMKLAVPNSSRPIPIPPYLPGQPVASGGAPLLPGQQPSTQSLLPQKPKIIPKQKMRQFQWLPLKPKEAVNTLWVEIIEPPIDEYVNELEVGYGDIRSITKEDSNKETKETSEKKSKPKKESLFDGRRTQNIAITIGKLKKSPDEIYNLIAELDPRILTADLTFTLLPLVPTPDDTKLIRGYEGKEEDLDIPGRVMSRLVDIPRLELRLKTHITSLTWEDAALKLENKLDAIGDAVAELRDESCLPGLKEIFSLILAIGNYMNGGTNKGQAHGIKINGLLKLIECRRNGSKIETLLHEVVKLYRLKHSDDELFYTQWVNVWAAKGLSLKQLEIDLKDLEIGLNDVKKELDESDKIHLEELKIPLKRNLSTFLSIAQPKYKKNFETLGEVRKVVLDIRQYFGDNTPDTPEEDAGKIFFTTLTEFALQYMKAMKEIDEWAEQKRKAEEAAVKAEKERLRRVSVVAMNVGLFKSNQPANKAVDAFRLYQEEQALSSEDRVAFFKKQMMDRRGAMNQTAPGRDPDEESEEENEDNFNDDDEWET